MKIPVRYGQPGLRYGAEFVETNPHPMIQITLALHDLTDAELISEVRAKAKGLTDHAADFPGVTPDSVALNAAAKTFEDLCSDATTKAQEAMNATGAKDAGRPILEGTIAASGAWCTGNIQDPAIISKVFTLKSDATVTTSIGQITNLSSSFGDEPGEVHLAWNGVAGTQGHEIQCKLPGGGWTHAKSMGKKTNVDIQGLTSGQTYQFRVRALGPNDLQGPWSDITEHMVP